MDVLERPDTGSGAWPAAHDLDPPDLIHRNWLAEPPPPPDRHSVMVQNVSGRTGISAQDPPEFTVERIHIPFESIQFARGPQRPTRRDAQHEAERLVAPQYSTMSKTASRIGRYAGQDC